MSQDQNERRVEIDPMDVALGVQIAKSPFAYVLSLLTIGVFKGIWFLITIPFQLAKEASELKRQEQEAAAQAEAKAKELAEHRSRVTATIIKGLKDAPLRVGNIDIGSPPPLPATEARPVARTPDPEREKEIELYRNELLEIKKSISLGGVKVDPTTRRINTVEMQTMDDKIAAAKTLVGIEDLAHMVVQFPSVQEILQRWGRNPQEVMKKLTQLVEANNDHPALTQTELTNEAKAIFAVTPSLAYKRSGPPAEAAIVEPKHILYALLFFEKTGRIRDAMGIPSYVHPMTYNKS